MQTIVSHHMPHTKVPAMTRGQISLFLLCCVSLIAAIIVQNFSATTTLQTIQEHKEYQEKSEAPHTLEHIDFALHFPLE